MVPPEMAEEDPIAMDCQTSLVLCRGTGSSAVQPFSGKKRKRTHVASIQIKAREPPVSIEEVAFKFNVTESTTLIPASLGSSEILSSTTEADTFGILHKLSIVRLTDAREHGITPLGEDEDGSGFLLSLPVEETSGGGGPLLPGPST